MIRFKQPKNIMRMSLLVISLMSHALVVAVTLKKGDGSTASEGGEEGKTLTEGRGNSANNAGIVFDNESP